MQIDGEKFNFVKVWGEELYKSFGPVRCPYLSDLVHFNSAGLEHLKFKRAGIQRLLQDQAMRFKLLHLAPIILKLSRTVQGVMSTNTFERIAKNGKNQWEMRPTVFYEFIAVIDNIRVRIVVKRVGNGSYMFWSIIPFWKNGKQGERQLFDLSLQDE